VNFQLTYSLLYLNFQHFYSVTFWISERSNFIIPVLLQSLLKKQIQMGYNDANCLWIWSRGRRL